MFYFTYLFTSGGLYRDLRSQYLDNLKKTIHKNYPYIFKIVFSLIVIFIFQITVQWQVITRSKSLVSSDPFFYLKNVYYLIDNQTISPEINFFYVPGHIILCAAISLIYKDYVLIYYFLKFGGIFFLFLFVLVMFFLGLSIFRKIHMGFICSLLMLSFYLYIWRITAFYSSALAVFFFGTSLLLIVEEKKLLPLFGFSIPLTFYLNPPVIFYGSFLFISVFIYECFKDDKKEKGSYPKMVFVISFLAILLLIPYSLYLTYIGSDLFLLFRTYLKASTGISLKLTQIKDLSSLSNIIDIITFFTNSYPSITRPLFQNLIDFLITPTISVAFLTLIIYLIFSIMGWFYRPNSTFQKKLLIQGKLSLLLIFGSYILFFLFLHNIKFFLIFQDRVFAIYSPFLVVLAGFGFYNLEEKSNSIIARTRLRLNFIKNKKYKRKNSKYYFSIENLFLFLLGLTIIMTNYAQLELLYEFDKYHYDDDTIDSFLYLRNITPKGSNIMLMYKTSTSFIENILYDMNLEKITATEDLTFNELNYLIVKKNIDFILIQKSEVNSKIIKLMSSNENYEINFVNTNYIIYSLS